MRRPSRPLHLPSPGRAPRTWCVVVAVLVQWLAGVGCERPRRIEAPHHLVLISIDTLRADRLGCNGHAGAATPHVDALAAAGVLFDVGVTPAPLTLPAHSSLFTGLLPCAHGVRDNPEFRLSPEATTLAERLTAAGWSTGAFVGSAALDAWHGLDQGFAIYDDALDGPVERSCLVTNDRAGRWLRDGSDGRSFLFVHYWEPHSPYVPADGAPQGGDPSLAYDADVTRADACVGDLLARIRELGRTERTLVVLVSDHGEGLLEHGEREHGSFLYDSTIRVPILFAGAGLPQGLRVGAPAVASLVDVVPTILDLLAMEPAQDVDGASLVPAMQGKVSSRPAYAETLHPALAHGYSQLKSVRHDGWKLVAAPRPELYDLAHDPGEERDRSAEQPKDARRLAAELRALVDGCLGHALEPVVAPQSAEDLERLRALGYVGSASGLAGVGDELDFTGTDPKDRAREMSWFQEGIELAARGELGPAEALLRRVLETDADDPVVLQTLGTVLVQGHRPREAARELERAHELLPDDFETGYALAVAWSQVGRGSEAMGLLEELAAKHPDRPRARVKLAKLRALAGDLGEAARQLRLVLETAPGTFDARLSLGDVLANQGDMEAAAREYEAALELRPDEPLARARLQAARAAGRR